ncbi:MAG: DUF599 family protein [Endozoicomonas sp. (ex Botrylloides leachii)]|nr:DUF599 family protein [Endozoicomonas sp. (ex Botrylloides leachii)]
MASATGSLIDWVALTTLLTFWSGYTLYAKRKSIDTPCIASVLALYRRDWMLRLLRRDNRTSDASLLTNLRAGVSFFASTSILVIAGLITGIAASEQAVGVLSTIPFVVKTSRELWEIKLLVMVVIFVYSFFEFTWSHRLYNFAGVIIGSAPLPEDIDKRPLEQQVFATRAGQIITVAAYHFNLGLRAYYFAMATMAWFISPWLLIFSSMLVVIVLYRREFYSNVLSILACSDKQTNI